LTGPMTHHLDADILAEFHAGLISGRRGARIADHLAGCQQCTMLGAQLSEVSVLLAAIPAPAMPPHVAERLDTVLAAEVTQRIHPERPRVNEPEPSRHPRRTGNRGFRLVTLRVLAPAAAVLLAAAGYGLSRLGGGPTGQSSASSAASTALRAHAPVNAAPESPAEPRAKPALMTPHSFTVHLSDTDYQRATLQKQLDAELRAPVAARSSRAPSSQVVSCVRSVTGGANPTYVESARFGGQPATIIVVSRKAWVAGARCSAADKDLLATTTLPPGI
jgi:hypothetical protein